MSITYKGKEYPTRNITIIIDREPTCITIVQDSLSTAFGENPDKWDEEAKDIDEQIYFYVARGCFKKSDEYIAKHCLDEEFELYIEEDEALLFETW